MANWEKVPLTLRDGTSVTADAPRIISASRSTDIPACYFPWFMNRLKAGYCTWINPFNGRLSYISFARCLALVFWSKNPAGLLARLTDFQALDIPFYLLYTINDYEKEGFEKYLPPLEERIKTFITLARRCGTGKVLWRFDPIILTEGCNSRDIISRVKHIASRLEGLCSRLIVSFVEVEKYKKVQNNLKKAGVIYSKITEEIKWEIAGKLKELGSEHGFSVRTCGEETAFDLLGIKANKCVDDGLLKTLYPDHKELNDFIDGRKGVKDPGQRRLCGCFPSKDIGRYSTCPQGCIYCYANTSYQAALANYKKHDPLAPGI